MIFCDLEKSVKCEGIFELDERDNNKNTNILRSLTVPVCEQWEVKFECNLLVAPKAFMLSLFLLEDEEGDDGVFVYLPSWPKPPSAASTTLRWAMYESLW